MVDAPAATFMTAGELLEMPDDNRHQYELVRGKLICMAPSSSRPSIVAMRAAVRIGSFIDQHGLGIYGGADWGMRLASNPDTVRAPDFGFIRAERVLPEGIPAGFWPGGPDLAVEVLSPSDRFAAVMERVQDYLDAGTRLVWAIDPESRHAAVFRPAGPVTWVDENGVLDGEDILPGFSLPLRDVLV